MSEQTELTPMKMRWSFNGAFKNANDALKIIADTNDAFLKDEILTEESHSECLNRIGEIDSALCLYRDVILGILKGDVSHEEARDFLCLEGDVLTNTKYDASVVTIKDK